MNRFSKYLTIIFLLLLTASAYAQNDSLFVKRQKQEFREKPAWTEKITFGGNFGLQFGQVTQINISPLIGYRITDQFIAGGGPSFIYTSYRIYGRKFENTILGGRAFAQHGIFENLAVRGEFEYLSIEYPTLNATGTDIINKREWVANPLIGLSYSFPLGRRSSFNITALYNLNYANELNKRYLYGSSPFVIRAGFLL
jgi:hypothetical protein